MKSGQWEGGYKQPETMTNTTSTPESAPGDTVAEYFGLAPINILAVKGRKIIPEKRKRRREGGLYMHWGDSRYFMVSYPRKLKAASEQTEFIPFRNSGQGKAVKKVAEKKVELGKV
jgi:hypothetical protein